MSVLTPPVGDQDQQTGNLQATVTLVEYGDYQCPHCGHAYPLVKQLLTEKGDAFRFVFRNFPLNEVHPVAMMAALAAEAAGKQEKFWQMHDLIFEQRQNLSGDILLNLAEQAGLNLQQFANDWRQQSTTDKVESDFESGIRSGVNGTPTFFVNGALLTGYDGSYQSLLQAVENA